MGASFISPAQGICQAMTNTTKQLGKLQRVDLREAWRHEAAHFTQWLAQAENLSVLGDELGIDLSLVQTEAAVGSFNVDILAEEENTGRKVIIENQLETTDHDHLGKLITYASGYEAQVIVWIVKDAREEHRQAVDWLNERTDEQTEFFLVRIELWQIGDSPLAPKFELVSKPNDWAKSVRRSTEVGEPTATKATQRDFWTRLQQYAKAQGSQLRFHRPAPQHWLNVAIGTALAHVALTINSREGLVGVELYIPDAKALFAKLLSHREEIEKELGAGAQWMELPGKKASRIRYVTEGTLEDTGSWESRFAWLVERAEALQRVLPKYIKQD